MLIDWFYNHYWFFLLILFKFYMILVMVVSYFYVIYSSILTNLLFCLGYHPLYLESNGPGAAAPQSGYAELDTTLMPPRGAPMGPQDQYRSTPSPRSAAAAAAGYAGSAFCPCMCSLFLRSRDLNSKNKM